MSITGKPEKILLLELINGGINLRLVILDRLVGIIILLVVLVLSTVGEVSGDCGGEAVGLREEDEVNEQPLRVAAFYLLTCEN